MGNKTQIETEIGWDLDLDLYDLWLVDKDRIRDLQPVTFRPVSMITFFPIITLSYFLDKSCG